eukprot:TRINITY_DN4189_c0_g1_i1.p1 TRINITY_DN4189_c0_g1~~TRINITY_DN4189_c0_g1_i1.p1  ORF type:complete len:276 (+),score=55.87 TRINITY_DN4189_c0_g1_i1:485-1312(+)
MHSPCASRRLALRNDERIARLGSCASGGCRSAGAALDRFGWQLIAGDLALSAATLGSPLDSRYLVLKAGVLVAGQQYTLRCNVSNSNSPLLTVDVRFTVAAPPFNGELALSAPSVVAIQGPLRYSFSYTPPSSGGRSETFVANDSPLPAASIKFERLSNQPVNVTVRVYVTNALGSTASAESVVSVLPMSIINPASFINSFLADELAAAADRVRTVLGRRVVSWWHPIHEFVAGINYCCFVNGDFCREVEPLNCVLSNGGGSMVYLCACGCVILG